MVRLFVRHTVADYTAWRSGYNGFDSVRRSMGVTADAVYQNADDANDITVTHDFDTLESAKAFASSTKLSDAMGKAGVTSAPTIWFTHAV